MLSPRVISFLGFFVMLLLAWLMSSHKKKVSLRVVFGGLFLQVAFALLILKTSTGQAFFQSLGDFFTGVLGYVDEGSAFLFDIFPRPDEAEGFPPQFTLWRSFAFGILPTIIFFSALMSILYHLGIMQLVVKIFAVIMQKTLGTSGAETLSAAANIFVGQTEAPLVIRPYVNEMTMSELNVVMVGGFATIAGGVLAAYVGMGIDAGHLITASVISAPAALMIAKVMQPETEVSKTAGATDLTTEKTSCVNVIEAAAEGASSGLQLALNVGAMLIAFVALVAMGNAIVGWAGGLIAEYTAYKAASGWTLEKGFGYLFYPFAWLMGIPADECLRSGEVLGTKMVVNEFVAYINLSGLMSDPETALSDRTKTILTYALCGFANFSSIGIQLGGIGGIAPERRADLARLGLRAMLGGTLAAFMTACIAGMLLPT
ncbi:MAG: NupC/NupG family nucleoside CNT transporter [Planctomycetaceae bacterium]